MSNARQQIFTKLVVHNKLLDEANAEKLLRAAPDPDKAIRYLVSKRLLGDKKARQLAALYHAELAKVASKSALSVAGAVQKAAGPARESIFDDLIDDVINDPEEGGDSSSHILTGSGVHVTARGASDSVLDGGDSHVLGDDVLADRVDSLKDASDSSLVLGGKRLKPGASGMGSRVNAPSKPQHSPGASAAEAAAALHEAAMQGAALAERERAEQQRVAQVADAIPLVDDDEDGEAYHFAGTQSKLPPTTETAPQNGTAAAVPLGQPTRGRPDPLMVELLSAARRLNASDLHLKSGEPPIVRVAGALREMEGYQPLSAERVEPALLSLLDSHQRARFLETNDLDLCYDGGELGRFRTNMMRQHRGMDGVFRVIAAELPSIDDLALPPVVKRFTDYKQGIVLITGPKGSGKTTTLAAMIDMINRTRPEHIITIEDPIEFVHPCRKGHVNQREVGEHTGSFSNALRAALREAPDVIMVGEMRDLETTSLAITAAETGHLVFATLHTPDAVRTIDRVLDVFPPKEQGQIRSMISESLRGIVSQLLVPGVDGNSQHLAVEIMVNTLAIGNMIREAKTFQLRGTMQTGSRLGMTLMDDSLVRLLKEGLIAKEEALSLAVERSKVEAEM